LYRSHAGQYLVTADDKGLVKLFNYPVVIEDAPHRAYRGHSSHVMCVRWSADDAYVASVGGKDWAMFQFKVAALEEQGAAAAAKRAGNDEGSGQMVWGPLDSTGEGSCRLQ
jgi:microtubule-associated protein-like 6